MSFEQKQYFESGVKYERERIIKIIESNQHITKDQAFFLTLAIKGEQK